MQAWGLAEQIRNIPMLNEYQSADSRITVALGGSYSYLDTVYRGPDVAERATNFPADTFRYRFLKRATDIFLVLASAPVLLPVLLFVAILVRVCSPGPIFFFHRRISRNGSFFPMWKFRTMCTNSAEVLDEYLSSNPEARAEWRATHKLRHDPRITRLGSFLRRYSIDELPQIWNVLKGEMTLIGPRPIVAAEVEKYGAGFACYCRVKPGVTGLWQVSGRSKTSYPQRVALDCDYVQDWSLWSDMKILARTFYTLFAHDGAY